MADSDKDILITPNTGAAADPKIVFSSGATSGDPITLSTVDDGTTSTLSFEGSAGQLFSISNDMSGTIFSVGDVSGVPSIEVDASGDVRIAEFGGSLKSYNTKASIITLSGTSVSMNTTSSDVFQISLTGDTTLSFSGTPTSGDLTSKMIIVTQGSGVFTMTWPTSIKWASGFEPTISGLNGAVDIFTFITRDAGTSWYGFVNGQSFA